MIVLGSENKNKSNFVLNEMVKRKILDMYNISKDKTPQKAAQEDTKTSEEIEEK